MKTRRRLTAHATKQQVGSAVLDRMLVQSLVAEAGHPLPQRRDLVAARVQHRAALPARVDVHVMDEVVRARNFAGHAAIARNDPHRRVEGRADRSTKATMRTFDERSTDGLLRIAEATLGE